MKRSSSSSHLASMNELVWKNGQILVQGGGGSSNTTQNTNTPSPLPPPCIKELAKHHEEDPMIITKRTKLTTSSYSLLDQRNDQHNSSQIDMQFFQNKSSSNVKEEFVANFNRPVKESKLPCSPFKKPRTDSSQTTQAATNCSEKQDQIRTEKVINFSNFLIPAVFLKSSSHQGNTTTTTTTKQTKTESLAARGVLFKGIEEGKVNEKAALATSSSSKALDDSTVIIESANKGSHGLTGFQNQTSLLTANHKLNVVASEAPPFDEHSEAVVGHTQKNSAIGIHRFRNDQCCNQKTSSSAALKAKGKAISSNLCTSEPLLLASSSVCSLGASNDPNICITTQENDFDDSTYLSDNDEETEDGVEEIQAQEGNRVNKRSRNAEIHSLTERKRRDKINKKMRALKELIPNCNEMDRASMLDDAIDYLKTLKLQLQIMSMGNGLCMPLMMIPAGAAHHLNAPQLPQLMGPAGMCLRPGTGIPCNPPHQFPIAPLMSGGITDNRLQMFGLSNQIPPLLPISHAPFIPMIGNSSNTQPNIMPTTITATNLPEHNIANPFKLTTPQELSVPKNSDFHAKDENVAMQPSN